MKEIPSHWHCVHQEPQRDELTDRQANKPPEPWHGPRKFKGSFWKQRIQDPRVKLDVLEKELSFPTLFILHLDPLSKNIPSQWTLLLTRAQALWNVATRWRVDDETKKKPRITSRNNSLAISVVMKRQKYVSFCNNIRKTKVPHRPTSTVTKFRKDGMPNLYSFRSFQLVTLLAERKAWQNHPSSVYTLAAVRYVWPTYVLSSSTSWRQSVY
jgi:hypothetical protein